jgi:hypothetical protein
VPAHGDTEAHSLDSQAADDKRCARQRIRKKNEGGEDQKKTRWHGQQSGVLHDRSFPSGWSPQVQRRQGLLSKPDEETPALQTEGCDCDELYLYSRGRLSVKLL